MSHQDTPTQIADGDYVRGKATYGPGYHEGFLLPRGQRFETKCQRSVRPPWATGYNIVFADSLKLDQAPQEATREEPTTDDPTVLMHRIEELERRGRQEVEQIIAQEEALNFFRAETARLRQAADRVPGLESANRRLTNDCRAFTDTVIKLQAEAVSLKLEKVALKKKNSEYAKVSQEILSDKARAEGTVTALEELFDRYTAALDALDARADKLLCEARDRQYGYFARMRKSLESQILPKVVRELRSVLVEQPAQKTEWTYYANRYDQWFRFDDSCVEVWSRNIEWAPSQFEEPHSYWTKLDSDPTKPREPKVWQSSDDAEPAVGTKVTNARGSVVHRRDNGWHYKDCTDDCDVQNPWGHLQFPLTEVGA